jgi:hypothetical protein
MADTLVAVADLKALDRSALESLVAAQQLKLSANSEALAAEQEKRISRDSEIEHLKLVIAKLQRMIFGTRSEKVSHEIEQLELKLEELETHESERLATTPAAHSANKRKPARRPLPDHLPREVHTHLPTEQVCPECHSRRERLIPAWTVKCGCRCKSLWAGLVCRPVRVTNSAHRPPEARTRLPPSTAASVGKPRRVLS